VSVLSDLIAPGRLRDGDPRALAALVAVGGWSVVSYCERAGAGEDVASAVVLAFVTFRRRAIQAGDDAAADLERILLESSRDAVDERSGEAPAAQDARAAEEAFARSSPRPLSPRLATGVLRALVDAAPVGGEPFEVRAAAERGYAEAYAAAHAAPAVTGEERLAPASPLLLRAAQDGGAAVEEVVPEAQPPEPAGPAPAPAAERPSPSPAGPRVRPSLPPALSNLSPRWVAGGGVLLLVVIVVIASGGGSDRAKTTSLASPTTTATTRDTTTATTTAPAAPATAQIIRGTPRAPLSASRARFEIVPITDASWAQKIRRQPRRETYRWVTVAVRTRNTGDRVLALRGLGYRLRTRNGAIIGPLVTELTGAPGGRLAVGRRGSAHLGFEIPPDAGSLTFAFDPGGLEQPTVLVPIGTGS